MHKSLFSFFESSKYPAGIIGLLSLFILFSACSKPPPHQAILILLDAARPDHFSSYGYGKDTTPEMDALAREGVRFDHCFTQGTYTRAALPSLIYSRYYAPPVFPYNQYVPLYNPGELFQGLDRACISIPRLLEANGFLTAAISAHDYLKKETQFAQEFMVFYDILKEEKGSGKSPYPRADKVIDKAIQWIKENKKRDYFLYMHLMDTHFPHYFGKEAQKFFGSSHYKTDHFIEGGWLVRDDVYTKEDIRYLNALYDGGLKYADSQVGRLAHFLKSIHRLNSTLIVVTADHGEMLLDRPGKIGHGGTWFDPLARIPLIVHDPAGAAPDIRSDFCEMVDIGPTMLQLLGMIYPRGKTSDGIPLIPSSGKETKPEVKKAVMMRGGVRTHSFKCIFKNSDAELLSDSLPDAAKLQGLLYDLNKDPGETTNLFEKKPQVVLDLLRLYRKKMKPLYMRSKKAAREKPLSSPFAISSRHFQTIPEAQQVSSSVTPNELFKRNNPNGWFHSINPDYDWIVGRPNAHSLQIEISIPNGKYQVFADMNGACRMRINGEEKLLRSKPFSQKLPWPLKQVEFGWVTITDNHFKAVITLQSKRPWFGLRQIGFIPEKSFALKDPDYKKRMERLKQLGYIK